MIVYENGLILDDDFKYQSFYKPNFDITKFVDCVIVFTKPEIVIFNTHISFINCALVNVQICSGHGLRLIDCQLGGVCNLLGLKVELSNCKWDTLKIESPSSPDCYDNIGFQTNFGNDMEQTVSLTSNNNYGALITSDEYADALRKEFP